MKSRKKDVHEEKETHEKEEQTGTKHKTNKETKSEVKHLKKELDKANKKIEELEQSNNELKDTLLRKIAEFENYKRRTEKDQLNLLEYAAESFILKILPVYDDLNRSISHMDDAKNIDSIKEGLKMVLEKFKKTLEEQGIEKIEAKNQKFDFNYHEALMQQPAKGVPPHTVLEEIEPGYKYKDKVIRHAKVIVSPDGPDSEESGADEENQNQSNNSSEE